MAEAQGGLPNGLGRTAWPLSYSVCSLLGLCNWTNATALAVAGGARLVSALLCFVKEVRPVALSLFGLRCYQQPVAAASVINAESLRPNFFV